MWTLILRTHGNRFENEIKWVGKIYLLRTMNVWIKFHENQPKSCWDIQLCAANVNVIVAPEQNQEKLAGFILWGPWISV